MWRDQPRDVPEVDPDTDGRKYWHYFFAHGQSFHGVATPIRDTPRDDLSIQKSNGYCLIGYCYLLLLSGVTILLKVL